MRDLSDDHQIEQIRAALCFVKKHTLALDIGAHRGIWSREMVKDFDEVTAIEPTDLYKQIDQSYINVINAACGAKVGKCRMQAGKKNTGQTFVTEGDEVDVITVDSLNVIPNFIKIDVEGMEYDVLKGGRKTILKHKPLIMIEENNLCLRYGHRINRASDLLKRWGMKPAATFHMLPEKDVNILWSWK